MQSPTPITVEPASLWEFKQKLTNADSALASLNIRL